MRQNIISKFKLSPVSYSFILVGLAFIVLYAFFKDILLHPNGYLFGGEGDGLKNYYTFIYYILYDSGSHFTGLNYPFGENVVFTDGQPFLALLANVFHHYIIPFPNQVLGLANLTMLFSLVIGAYCLYLVLRKNLLPHWYAIATAILIAFLTPQQSRLLSHYALAYSFFLPLFWYLIIRIFENKKKPLPYLIYILTSLISGFVHPYYMTIGNVMLLAYAFVYVLQEYRNFRKEIFFAARLVLTALTPIILFQLWLSLTDHIADRPTNPWGFFVYRAHFGSVFFPVESPLKEFFMTFFRTNEPVWEGFAYVGILGLGCLFLTAVLSLRYLIRLKIKYIVRPVLPQPLRIGIWAATLVLFFSMGLPFTWGLEHWLDYIPPLKQFRAIGRFAWVFYYIYSVYIAFYFYKLYRYLCIKRAQQFAIGFILCVFVIWALDIKAYLTPKVAEIKKHNTASGFIGEEGNYKQLLTSVQKNSTDFQAIIPLPHYEVGSEYFTIAPSPRSIFQSMRASVNLHLPIAANMMSRSSLSQSCDLAQLLSSDYIKKDLLPKLPSSKPFLLLVTKEQLSFAEQNLVNKARKLAENNDAVLYELPVNAFVSDLPERTAKAFTNKETPVYKQGNIYTTKTDAPVITNSYTTSKNSAHTLFDAGSLYAENGILTVFDGQIPAKDTLTLEASVWKFIDPKGSAGVYTYRQYDETNNMIEEKTILIKETAEIYKGWSKLSVKFQLKHPKNRIQLILEGDKTTADNLLIRPAYADVYYYTDGNKKLIFNNYLIRNLSTNSH